MRTERTAIFPMCKTFSHRRKYFKYFYRFQESEESELLALQNVDRNTSSLLVLPSMSASLASTNPATLFLELPYGVSLDLLGSGLDANTNLAVHSCERSMFTDKTSKRASKMYRPSLASGLVSTAVTSRSQDYDPRARSESEKPALAGPSATCRASRAVARGSLAHSEPGLETPGPPAAAA
jgi:hypothetical protein